MAMAKPTLKLYFDILSPFAYITFHIVHTTPVFASCDVTYVPVLLGGIMKACGNTAPIEIKNKQNWINVERMRWVKCFNVPIGEGMPPGFPVSTLAVQRHLCALSTLSPLMMVPAIAALYEHFFVSHKPIVKPDDFRPVLDSVLGKELAAKVAERSGDVGKKLLTENSEEAVSQGAFGLPWFVATNKKGETENFWGFDHIGQVIDHLGLEKPGTGGWRVML